MKTRSELSPSVTLRRNEKDELVGLNNRMAVYVDKVRSLEDQNRRLNIRVETFEESSKVEVRKIV